MVGKNIYLHIGSHKTGTSAIYQFLKKNKIRLEKEADFLFYEPDPWPLKMKRNSLDFSLRLKGFDKVSSLEAENIIISHENYSWLNKLGDWKAIFNSLNKNNANIKIIWYLRRQDSLAVSQKQEGTKWVDNSLAYGHDLEPLPANDKLTADANAYLDYLSKYNMLISVFGKKNVIVKIFEREKLVKGDIVDDFCDAIKLPIKDDYFIPGRVNESIPMLVQMFLHKTRKYFNEYSLEKKYLTRFAIKLGNQNSQKYLPSKEQAKIFYSYFKNDNNILFKSIFGKEGQLFKEDWSAYPDTIIKEDLTLDELNEMYSLVIKSMSEELELWRNTPNNVENENVIRPLINLAKNFEKKNDFVSALDVMKIALNIRPNGPFILNKIAEYEGKINVEN